MLPLLLMALTGVAPQPAAAEAPRPAPRAELRCQAACRERDAAAGAIMVTPVPDVAPVEPAASRVERSLARLNALRTASGTHPVARSELLSLSASRHAAYLSANGFRTAASVHAEAAGLDGFTGADPFARMRAAGYRSTYATEVVGDIGLQATDTDCVDHLMGTVYHATLLLSRVTEAGMAYGVGAAGGACVIDLGVPLLAPGPQATATGQIVRYPWAGMTAPAGTLRLDLESPRPSRALLPDARVGMPVSSWVTVSRQTPSSPGPSISQVSRLKPSAAAVGSISIRQVCTSRRGGSTSSTSPSTITSGSSQPMPAAACFIGSVTNER